MFGFMLAKLLRHPAECEILTSVHKCATAISSQFGVLFLCMFCVRQISTKDARTSHWATILHGHYKRLSTGTQHTRVHFVNTWVPVDCRRPSQLAKTAQRQETEEAMASGPTIYAKETSTETSTPRFPNLQHKIRRIQNGPTGAPDGE